MKTKKKMYVVSTVGMGTVIFFVFFIIRPTIQETKRLHDKFIGIKQQINQLMVSQSTNDLLMEQVAVYSPQLAQLQSGLLIPGKEVAFIEFLEDTSHAHGVTQTLQISPLPPDQNHTLYTSSTMQITLQGSFLDFLEYLKALELSPYYVNVKSIVIKALQESPQPILQNILPADIVGNIDVDIESEDQQEATRVGVTIAAEVFWYQLNNNQ